MTKHVQTLIRRLVVVQAILLMLVMGATPAFADSGVPTIKEIYGGTQKVALVPEAERGSLYLYYLIPNRGKVTKITSSKKSVATASVFKDEQTKKNYLVIEGKKAGTAKIKYTYKGKRHTVKFVFKKWVKPVKSLTIGGKQFASRFKTHSGFPYSEMYGKTGNDLAGKKVKVTAAAGWKLKAIKYISKSKLKTMKNGGKVPKVYGNVIVELQNKKTGIIETIWMY